MLNIMDTEFNGMGGSEFYRAQVFPELFPHEKPMLIDNWTVEDKEMFCGTASRQQITSYTINGTGKEVN